ncbi:hypothetical protein VP01_241g5 [Puccinia sorghi]|uniref:Uncharacterized protein n=1 Tax=Puccinia sorghi TaxID=27349 RepID=A0A0L6V779_9BASI|nr:hypothetical protein VP01_241g5 [Puccinia sorghi]
MAAWLEHAGYQLQEIINAILCDEFVKFQDQITRQSHQQNSNWKQIKQFNNELKPFNFLIKELEGDGPTGAFVLANYYQTIKDLKKKEASEEYQEEALECEALVMANLLHPAFNLRFFAHCWPEREQQAQLILEKNFNKRERNN